MLTNDKHGNNLPIIHFDRKCSPSPTVDSLYILVTCQYFFLSRLEVINKAVLCLSPQQTAGPTLIRGHTNVCNKITDVMNHDLELEDLRILTYIKCVARTGDR